MTITPGDYKPSFNSGEVAPEAAGRTEIKTYYSGARRMERVEPVPQGGFDQMPGTRQIGRARRLLSTAATVTLTIAGAPHAPNAVIATGDAGALVSAEIFDLTNITASVAASLRLEWRASLSDAWSTFATVLVDATARKLRSATAPFAPVSARYFRLVRIGGTVDTTVALDTALVLRIGGTRPATGRLFGFAVDRETVFDFVMTAGNIDIYRNKVFQCALDVPYTEAQLPAVRVEQRDKTMLVFHPDVAEKKILYQSDADWLIGDQVLKNIPKVDLGGTYTKTADQWRITIMIAATNSVQVDQTNIELTIGGEATNSVSLLNVHVWPAGANAVAALIKTAIEALANVETGITVTAEAPSGTNYPFLIEFTGADNLGTRFDVSGRAYSPVSAAVNPAHVVKADPGGEAIISPSRGYSRDGEFWQQRLVLAGFKAKGTALLASVQADYFNLNADLITTDGAILLNLDTSASDRIERVIAARHLLIFAQEAEYFISDRALSKTQPTNVVQSSRNGCAENVPVVVADNAVFYVNRNNSLVYACQYNEVAQAYESTAISLLASHLIENIVDAAYQRPQKATDAGRYLLVREDGLMLSANVVRDQEITGFVRWPTDGQVKRVMTNGADEVRLLVMREINGVDELIFEAFDDDLFFDQAISRSYGSATAAITGLTDHEGATVWALADGYVEGPFTVTSGAITLPSAALEVTLGRWTAPLAETLPPNREIAPNKVLRRPGHVAAVETYIMDTTSLAIGANGRAPKAVPLYRGGMAVDVPLAPQTGFQRVAPIFGYVKEPTVVITQLKPGKLKVRDVTIEQRL